MENIFSLMADWRKKAKRAGWSQKKIDAVLKEARSGDYWDACAVLLDNAIS